MTASATTTHSSSPREPITKPSILRRMASIYVDILVCAFLAWVVCFTFGWQAYWSSAILFVVVGELLWCRDRLHPTAGEFCVGIRYLTSSSTHVVADIQIIHPKLKLNNYILIAGVIELTLAFLTLSGWTFLSKAVLLGFSFGPPFSLIYWVMEGLAFFACSASLLSGSKIAPWLIIPIHLWLTFDFFKSAVVWRDILKSDLYYAPWVSNALSSIAGTNYASFVDLFSLWSLFLVMLVVLSRRHWVN
jgi:hypothetical protein